MFRSLHKNKNLLRMNLSTTIPMESYLSRAWLRQHLYYLGFDLIRLQSYQKLSKNIGTNAGGMIKSLVSDISTFLKRELNGEYSRSPVAEELRSLMSQYGDIPPVSFHNISECRLFFMTVGYMMLQGTTGHLDELTDRLVALYLSRNGINFTAEDDALAQKVVALTDAHFASCPINFDRLYSVAPAPIRLFVTRHISIELPPLPRIHNRKLLAKALVHKELYRGILHPDHDFHRTLKSHGIEPSEVRQIVRNELSFFDGLGDFYLAQESSNLLYQFKHSVPYKDDFAFGRKSYTLLKTILATNTLLSRLALAYKLHEGLDDPIVNGIFLDSYVPSLSEWKNLDFTIEEAKEYRYEQEFIADYFEQYVGTLFLEQPNVAQKWINEIYQNVLFSIRDEHLMPSKVLVQYDYNQWGVDVIGRRLK